MAKATRPTSDFDIEDMLLNPTDALRLDTRRNSQTDDNSTSTVCSRLGLEPYVRIGTSAVLPNFFRDRWVALAGTDGNWGLRLHEAVYKGTFADAIKIRQRVPAMSGYPASQGTKH